MRKRDWPVSSSDKMRVQVLSAIRFQEMRSCLRNFIKKINDQKWYVRTQKVRGNCWEQVKTVREKSPPLFMATLDWREKKDETDDRAWLLFNVKLIFVPYNAWKWVKLSRKNGSRKKEWIDCFTWGSSCNIRCSCSLKVRFFFSTHL